MLAIPTHLDFADLALERKTGTNDLLFAPGPLTELCRGTGLDPVEILGDEDLSCWIICHWYIAHVAGGGAPDPVAEQILAELADNPQPGASVV